MNKPYIKRVQKFSKQLFNPELSKYTRISNSYTFTRNRKMPLKDILLCCLVKKGLTTVFELRNHFQQKETPFIKMTKQGYLQQRKRLNPQVFLHLNNQYLLDFYHSSEPHLWNGYLLFAIDGSKAEVPNSKENREVFGVSANQY